jgi:ribosomal protein S18 acetylase RimI-like enzyme
MLKRAEADDSDAIAAFEADVINLKLYGRPLDRDGARLEIGVNECYLLSKSSHIIATGAVRRREDASVYLSNIAVHPERRRQGLARTKTQHLLSWCSDAPLIDLAVNPDN